MEREISDQTSGTKDPEDRQVTAKESGHLNSDSRLMAEDALLVRAKVS
jgi:hypothetical protein